MNVKLDAEFAQLVKKKVRNGEYPTHGEVIREGLRLLELRDYLRQKEIEKLREMIDDSREQFRRGLFTTYTKETLPQLIDKIKREGRKRLAGSRKRAG